MPNSIQKDFCLFKTDKEYDVVGGQTVITVRQATQKENASRDEFIIEELDKCSYFIEDVLKIRSDGFNHRLYYAIFMVAEEIHALEVFLTLAACNIEGDMGKPLFIFEDGKVDSVSFKRGWALLAPLVADEIHEIVLEMNPDWSGELDRIFKYLLQKYQLETRISSIKDLVLDSEESSESKNRENPSSNKFQAQHNSLTSPSSSSEYWFRYYSSQLNPAESEIPTTFQEKVVGVTHENRQEIVKKLSVGEKGFLVRDPDNPFDRNAIKVVTRAGEHFGFLRRELASLLAERFDEQGKPVVAHIVALTGGTYSSSNLGVRIKFSLENVQNDIENEDNSLNNSFETVRLYGGGTVEPEALIGQTVQKWMNNCSVGTVKITAENLPMQLDTFRRGNMTVSMQTQAEMDKNTRHQSIRENNVDARRVLNSDRRVEKAIKDPNKRTVTHLGTIRLYNGGEIAAEKLIGKTIQKYANSSAMGVPVLVTESILPDLISMLRRLNYTVAIQ